MRMVGAATRATIEGEETLPGKVNYFIGNEPSLWHTNVATFAKVRYREIYPGIDLVYYGREGRLEYDFVVAPGADPNQIEVAIDGADTVQVDGGGDLRLEVAGRELVWRKPVVFQEEHGVRIPVRGEYVMSSASDASYGKASSRFSFRMGAYDPTVALVIDPALVYSTYLGGDYAVGQAIAVDANGSAYVTGDTTLFFPVTPGAFQEYNEKGAAFVTKFSPAGDQLIYSTLLGGPTWSSYGKAIVVDGEGRAIVTGNTGSSSFPTRNAIQRTFGGDASDAFVTMFTPDGSGLVFSTYLGGTKADYGESIAIDSQSNIVVAGQTGGGTFPKTNAVQATFGGQTYDWFVTKFNPDGTRRLFSTYLGGADWEDEVSMALDSADSVYVAGLVGFSSVSTTVAKLSSDGSKLVYMRTNLLPAACTGVAVDSQGAVYLTGRDSSGLLPTTSGAFQTTSGGGLDAFVGKLNPAGTEFEYLTYIGGVDYERDPAITVDKQGNAFVAGATSSTNFPTREPFQAQLPSYQSELYNSPAAFILKLNPSGSGLIWSTFFGGSLQEQARALALDITGAVYVTGEARSTDLPLLNAFQAENNSINGPNAFVAKFEETQLPIIQITRLGNSVLISWPAAVAGFSLESTDSLPPTSSWVAEPTAPVLIGDQSAVTLEIGTGARYFRLVNH